MRHQLPGLVTAALVGVVFLAAAWMLPGVLDGPWLADRLLQPAYRLPELISAYVPELVRALRLVLLTAAGAAVLLAVAWMLGGVLFRPTGPGKVMQGVRRVTWLVLLLIVLVGVYSVIDFVVLGGLDTVERTTATWLALGAAVGAAVLFLLLSLFCTERMIRPAVPFGHYFVGRS